MIWFLAAIATYRLTRLFTADRITEGLRIFIIRRSKMFGYLVTCDWCLSIWFGMALSYITYVHQDQSFLAILYAGLAFSALTGFLSMIETRLEA